MKILDIHLSTQFEVIHQQSNLVFFLEYIMKLTMLIINITDISCRMMELMKRFEILKRNFSIYQTYLGSICCQNWNAG